LGVSRSQAVLQAVVPSLRTVSLTDLRAGASARLHDVGADPESRALLRALGLTEGSVLRVCQQGDPCIIVVRSTRIGIASRVARHVVVVPHAGTPLSDAADR
jgi:Fe2+ transport system protein FeoA